MLEAELRALMSPTRREEGCWQYDLHHAIDQPGMFLLHEVWESREHHTEHTKTPHFLRWNARKDALLPPANPPSGSNWRRERLLQLGLRRAVCSRRGAEEVGAKPLTPGTAGLENLAVT